MILCSLAALSATLEDTMKRRLTSAPLVAMDGAFPSQQIAVKAADRWPQSVFRATLIHLVVATVWTQFYTVSCG